MDLQLVRVIIQYMSDNVIQFSGTSVDVEFSSEAWPEQLNQSEIV